ncbi:hypothetical protein SESBI_26567 [Sesbania bispinosa]|nr:hypothetical protein SESBI_26567 [Sesbania bispinosa]
MGQLQEQNQTLQSRNQTCRRRVTTLARGHGEEEDAQQRARRISPILFGNNGNAFPTDFRQPPLKDYDGTTDPQAHVTTFKTQMLKTRVGRRIAMDEERGEAKDKEEVRGVVTTIVGGFSGRGETNSARREICEASNGGSIQMGIQPHQDDPMVIDVTMAKYRVQRVLVDQGSLVGFAEISGSKGDSLKVRRRNSSDSKVEEGKTLGQNHKVCFIELDPREDFYERRPQPQIELVEV